MSSAVYGRRHFQTDSPGQRRPPQGPGFSAAAEAVDCVRFQVSQDVTSLEREWRSLEAKVEKPLLFQSYDWCLAWLRACEAAGLQEDVRIVSLWRNNRAVLIWPLAVRRLFGCRVLHSLGEPATQGSDVLVDPAENKQQLVKHVLATVRTSLDVQIIELRRIRDGSLLRSSPLLAGYAVRGSETTAPVLDFARLDNGVVDDHRSSRSRNALRRHERQIGALGAIHYELLIEPEQQGHAVHAAVALKRIWMREKAKLSSGYAHPASLGCLLEFARSGKLTAAQLRVGHRIAAIEIGIVQRACYWSLVQSYDFAFAKYAPGRLLFRHLLGLCPVLGIEMFDFLAPSTRHKSELSNVEIPVCDFLMPTSIAGSMARFYLAGIKPRLGQMASHLPPTVRQRTEKFVGLLS